MACCDTGDAALKEIVADKGQLDQRKVSVQNVEEGGEATSSGSMKSPVTPAAVCEANGTPALRWKSYTAMQKDSDDNGKLAGVSACLTDSKSKLVINLCGSSRSLVSRSPLETKAPLDLDKESKKFQAGGSLQERGLPPTVEDSGPSCRASGDVTASESLPSGSSESVQNCLNNLESRTSRHPNSVNDLAKIICRRIRMVRRTLKASHRRKTGRSGSGLCSKDVNSSEPEYVGVNSNAFKSIEEPNSSLHYNTASDVEKEASARGEFEGGLMNAALDGCKDASGSEELIYSEDEEGSVDRQYNERATAGLGNNRLTELVDDKVEASMKDVSTASTGLKNVALTDAACSQQMPVSANDLECTLRDVGVKNLSNRRDQVRSLSHDPGAFSETSKLDMKEQTVLETLLRDEPPGYSSGGGSEPSRSRVERSGQEYFPVMSGHEDSGQSEDSEGTDSDSECSETDDYDEEDSASSESYECDDEDCNCSQLSPIAHITSKKAAGPMEQVPSVLCDTEGNVWHIGKRAKQAKGKASLKQLCTFNRLKEKTSSFAKKLCPVVLQELGSERLPGQPVTPYAGQIELNWRCPSDADYAIGSLGDVSNRSMVYKEKAIFVGCIPDGTENLEDVLQTLMEKFLERFDFAPPILSQIQLVKVVKDFAFLELATEKVAHIVLAANQLDVFEWGVNGFHFNIEGCKGTHTSVRPLIEYMPLKPSRVIFVGNIPKSRWQKDFLEEFFARILKGGDGPSDCHFVNCIYLLPESCDAYVEFASEVMADAIIFKCTKNLHVLKEIGEDVFICRDPSSVPLMSKHKGNVCPQRSLYVGVSGPGQEFKIDLVRKVLEELLPVISRKINQPGYLEFISVQPGKDYAFFQFNSESIVNAVMEEYIVNTHFFVCTSSPLSYIILRPPGYVRPGARYRADMNRNGRLDTVEPSMRKHSRNAYWARLVSSRQSETTCARQLSMGSLLPRRFGDEPVKKTDCIMSIGASPLPEATWNGLSSIGACAADPECILMIEGLPKGLSYKLLRGALNELFEKCLSKTGLLEVGMLVLRHLNRDANFDVVASFPSAKFARALLSSRKTLVVAGTEIKLLPKGGRRKVTWKGHTAEHGTGPGEVSCLSDDEIYQQERLKNRLVDVTTSTIKFDRRKQATSHFSYHGQARKIPSIRRNCIELDPDTGYAESLKNLSPSLKKDCQVNVRGMLRTNRRVLKVLSRPHAGTHTSRQGIVEQGRENAFNGIMPHVHNSTGFSKFGERDLTVTSEDRTKKEDFPSEILHIVSEGGKRKIQAVRAVPEGVKRSGRASVLKLASKKRKLVHLKEDICIQNAALMQRSCKKLYVPSVL